MEMKKIWFLLFNIIFVGICYAQNPEFRHVFDIHAKCSVAKEIGNVPHGKRVIIPIIGGEVRGSINGRILSGGADYQMIDTLRGRTELKAVYSFITNDSTYVNVTNEGIISADSDNYYFLTSPKFECDLDSPYAWLNNRIFVCRPVEFKENEIVLRVWEVK